MNVEIIIKLAHQTDQLVIHNSHAIDISEQIESKRNIEVAQGHPFENLNG